MSLFKRGRVWWVQCRYKGKRVRKATGVTDKKLAVKIYHKMMTDMVEGRWFDKLPGEEKTFQELMEKYLKEHSIPNKAATSHIRDKSLSAHLTTFFGSLTITDITSRMVSEYKAKRRMEGAASKTINNELILMGHAYNLAIKEWEWVRDNPVRRVTREKVNNLIERWLTVEEEERLYAVCPDWLREIVVFAINTGLRQSEILRLKWPQVDLSRRTIAILEQKNKGKDTLPINKNALEILQRRARVRSIKTPHVFYNGNGNPIHARNLLRAFYSSLKKAKLEGLRFHDLRHTFATRLVQEGVDLYTVQKLGRWKTISMVMRYAHHYPESLRPGVEVLDRIKVEHSLDTIWPQSDKNQ